MPKTEQSDLMVPGFKISHLTLVSKESTRHKLFWLCKCDCEEQNQVKRRQDYLIKCLVNSERIVSCGCKHPLKTTLGSDSRIWKGYGNLSGQHFSSIRAQAKTRNLEFDITIEDAWNLFVSQDSRCALTGREITLVQSMKKETQTASLDRIDSSKGYILGNVQWIHKDINLMKNNFDQAYFIQCCKEICAWNQ